MNDYQAITESANEEQSLGSCPNEQTTDTDAEPPEPTLRVLIANEQSTFIVEESKLSAAVQSVLANSPYTSGTISLAVVDDPTIHEINRQYLEHDYPTDVLSFVLEDREPYLEGELVVSTDTASRNAAEYGWPAESELLLYIIHGALHLVGYRDKLPEEIAEMRAAEAKLLGKLGIVLPSGDTRWLADEGPSS